MDTGVTVHGIVGRDSNWRKMKRIWDACIDGDVAVPEVVLHYFEACNKSVLHLGCFQIHELADAWYYDIDVEKLVELPEGVSIVRVMVPREE